MTLFHIYEWLSGNYIELIGTILSLLYLYFSIKQKTILWFFGMISSGIYVWIYYKAKIYADMGLYVYYVGVSIYGWYIWTGGVRPDKKRKMSRVKYSQLPLLFGSVVLIYVILAYILINYTDSPVPYLDAFTTSGSIVATWMLARKMLEHWLFWIVIDLVSIVLYIYRGLYTTVVLFIIYTIMSVIGYIQWRKAISNTQNEK